MPKMFKATGSTIQVCPYVYRQCTRTAPGLCEIRARARSTDNVVAWNEVVSQAIKCDEAGRTLTRDEYINRSQGEVIEY